MLTSIRSLATALALGIAIASCGGVPTAGSPAEAVRQAFRLVDEGNLEGLLALTCDAQKETIRRQFTFSDLAGQLPGVDMTQLFIALNVDASGLTVTETSVQSDTATVQLAGRLGFSFEAERLREIFRQMAQQQGQQVDDATLDRLITALQATATTVPVNETLQVAHEGGSWKICGRLTLMR